MLNHFRVDDNRNGKHEGDPERTLEHGFAVTRMSRVLVVIFPVCVVLLLVSIFSCWRWAMRVMLVE
jgi:hypothetical protein